MMPPAPEVTLVEATLSDADALFSDVQQLHCDEHVPLHPGVDNSSLRVALQSLITTPALGRIWLIRMEEKTVGYAALNFFHSLEFAGRCGLLDEFFLQPAYRGQGIGKAALNWICQTAAPKLGVRAVFLEVSPGNAAAQGLYHAAGFEARPYNFMVRMTDPKGSNS
jgi:GNAT superfamily N-acetyltransferase